MRTIEEKNHFIKYIITELSLKKNNAMEYIDVDSNYFRQLLSMEGFKILKTPYYQPYFNVKHELSFSEFNIAIKPLLNGLYEKTEIDETFYFELLRDIYENHYASWYKKYVDVNKVEIFFNELLKRIKKEFTGRIEISNITLVNCVLFQNGLCQQISTENITLRKKQKYYIKQCIINITCIIFSIMTVVLCYFDKYANAEMLICSIITMLSAILSIRSIIKNHISLK